MKRRMAVVSMIFATVCAAGALRASNMPPRGQEDVQIQPRTSFELLPIEEQVSLSQEISREVARRLSAAKTASGTEGAYVVLPAGHVAKSELSISRDERTTLTLALFDGSTRRILFDRAAARRAAALQKLLADPSLKTDIALILPSPAPDPLPADRVSMFDAARRRTTDADDSLARR